MITRASFNKLLLGLALAQVISMAGDSTAIATEDSAECAEEEVPPRIQ